MNVPDAFAFGVEYMTCGRREEQRQVAGSIDKTPRISRHCTDDRPLFRCNEIDMQNVLGAKVFTASQATMQRVRAWPHRPKRCCRDGFGTKAERERLAARAGYVKR